MTPAVSRWRPADSALLPRWEGVALRGVLALIFGGVTLTMPGLGLAALVTLFGAYALAEGAANVIGALRAARRHQHWRLLLLEGVISVVVGIATLWAPGIVMVALAIYVGIWALLTGVLEVGAAIFLRKYIRGEWLLAAMGLVSTLFGLALITAPMGGAVALMIWIGSYALVAGVLLVGLAFKLHAVQRGPHADDTHHGAPAGA